MIATLIILAMGLPQAPTGYVFAPVDEAPITITSDNLDLNGSGILAFKPEPAAFLADLPEGRNDLAVTVRLWLNPSGKPVSCDLGQSLQPRASQIGCAQLMKSARYELFAGMALPFRRGFVDVTFSFFKDPPSGPAGLSVFARPMAGYRNTVIVYPPDNTPLDQLLQTTDGKLVTTISPDDYPSMALRYEFESNSAVLLGISRDGRVRSCRPVSSSSGPNTAFLDNYTCYFLLQRSRFEFAPMAPAYQGLKYKRQKLTWKLPGQY